MEIGQVIAALLDRGWKITRCSCTCGGNWAWMKPRPSGADEMVGCVCHNTPKDAEGI